MANAFRPLGALHLRGDLARLRSHAATVRSLLDELERAVPATGGINGGASLYAEEQLAEELARLGCRLIESAATMTSALPSPPTRPRA